MKHFLFATAAFLIFQCGPAQSEDFLKGILGEIAKTQSEVIFKSGKSVDETIAKQLAERGNPIRVRVDVDQTLMALIQEQCSDPPQGYIEVIRKEFKVLNPKFPMAEGLGLSTLDIPLKKGEDVIIPPILCPSGNTDIHEIAPGENLWKVYIDETSAGNTNLSWDDYKKQVARLNKRSLKEVEMWEIGARVVVPRSRVSILLPNELVREITIKPVGTVVEPADNIISVEPNKNWGVLQHDSSSDSIDQCAGGNTQIKPFDYAEMAFIQLAASLLQNELPNNQVEWVRQRSPARIAIFDSGVMGLEEPFLSSFVRNLSGTNQADMVAIPAQPKKEHGTEVLVLSAGGHLFARMNAMLRLVEVLPVRVTEEHIMPGVAGGPATSAYAADPNQLDRYLVRAQKPTNNVSVVNISLSFGREIEGFNKFISIDNPYLIVAAAGNQSLHLGQETTEYPAMYGGNDDNVVTVGAISNTKIWLPFSNYSSRYVDIAAWGCNVPTLRYNEKSGAFETVVESGTSFAAPQVSMVASLLSREQRSDSSQMTPIQIKRRILAASDVHRELWGSVKHGRVLNVQKALDIHSDNVVLHDGRVFSGKLMFEGELNGVANLCPDVEMPISDIRKIVDLGTDVGGEDQPEKRYMIYGENSKVFNEPDQRPFETHWCDSLLPAISIQLAGISEAETINVSLENSQISDMVFGISSHGQ